MAETRALPIEKVEPKRWQIKCPLSLLNLHQHPDPCSWCHGTGFASIYLAEDVAPLLTALEAREKDLAYAGDELALERGRVEETERQVAALTARAEAADRELTESKRREYAHGLSEGWAIAKNAGASVDVLRAIDARLGEWYGQEPERPLDEAVATLRAELEKSKALNVYFRDAVGECHVMISRDTSEYQVRSEWESTELPPRFQKIMLRLQAAEATEQALRDLCSAVYQMAGAYEAPVRFLDALSAAAAGTPFTVEGLLPCFDPDVEAIRDEPVSEEALRAVPAPGDAAK